jgi:hypothetical protein
MLENLITWLGENWGTISTVIITLLSSNTAVHYSKIGGERKKELDAAKIIIGGIIKAVKK